VLLLDLGVWGADLESNEVVTTVAGSFPELLLGRLTGEVGGY
jgi:hypothetical protein